MAELVEIFEVGPRDGLQNEPRAIPYTDKIALIDILSRAGFQRIEAASVVSPKRVPQMADGEEVLLGIERYPQVSYAALVPNLTGLDRARTAKADEVAVFASASDGFSRANLGCSIWESLERYKSVIDMAKVDNLPVRGYVSCVTDCPYDGPTPPDMVALVAKSLADMGCYEVSLGDTIGKGRPETVSAMLVEVLRDVPAEKLAGHFHDTNGRALENVQIALAHGLRVFDAAIGGLGGCPFAPGASGNVATGALNAQLTGMGFETRLRPDVLEEAAKFALGLRNG
ncbi:MAG: hydroxymethylglutaryl-CoA lyase [Rhodobacteraceae bacterium]|nr:hydroxymethylglutaryl-CoA lyase [Paracoccaceae bacterium]